MLTPSPLRRRPLFPHSVDPEDQDDIFLQSPFNSPLPVHRLYPQQAYKRPSVPIDDDDGSIFLSSSSAATSPFFPASTSQPLRTPVKDEHRVNARSILKSKHLNIHAAPQSSSKLPATTRVGVGTKRKSSAQSGGFSTPLRQPVSTPLPISAAKADPTSGVAFHRLAPLAAPRFVTRTPQSKAETEAYVKKQAETLKRLRIRDMDNSDEEWGVIEDEDSGCEIGKDHDVARSRQSVHNLPLSRRSKSHSVSPKKPLLINVVPQKGNAKEEVTEAISPGGHILKRRARSRPVSVELLESVNQTSSHSASSQSNPSSTHPTRPPTSPPVAFPSVARNRLSVIPNASSPSDCGSPMPRRRVTGSSGLHPFQQLRHSDASLPRASLSRLTSSSSASLFFGPSIPQTSVKPRTRTNTTLNSATSTAAAKLHLQKRQPSISNRHSYAGPGSETMSPLPWTLRRSALITSSPESSPPSIPQPDEDDMFFEPGPPETSFVFSVTEGTPSPRSQKARELLPSKYKPRDSGVVLSDDEDASNREGDFLSTMARTSTSASSLYSDAGDDLVTPGVVPSANSGWPTAVVLSGLDDGDRTFSRMNEDSVDVDAFILRTLATGGKHSSEESKKPPGTPVKKPKTSYLAGDRPWQSAVAAKVGFNGLDLGTAPVGKAKNGPRKSLPAAFPPLGARMRKGKTNLHGSDSDEEGENSPSSRKEGKYEGLGLGRPPAPCGPAAPVTRTRWLMRRSSSGAFSSGSETSIATPTRRKDWPLPPRVSLHNSPTINTNLQLPSVKPGSRSSSNSSGVSLSSPTVTRRQLPSLTSKRAAASPLVQQHGDSDAGDKTGRFEREFVEIDQIGSGEFGKVMKVRAKNGPGDKVWAVKRSKPFEGARHRMRLREEVDILQHLAEAAALAGDYQGQHPNVLAYIDSWEQDHALFIQTELCELGNFAHFLWEYGKAFPRLDEARVWKIFVDLSNGLRFIHESGVIHLDLKPANIFLTREGRFKIGDFGMASLWPRASGGSPLGFAVGGFEREGDKVYLAREVLQGTYGKAADIFSFGMTMLEAASNIVVPDQGDGWHRLRQEDFSQVDLSDSPELLDLIKSMMRTNPAKRIDVQGIYTHPVIVRARSAMERACAEAKATGTPVFAASPLAGVSNTFLEEILGCRNATASASHHLDDVAMDLSP
ncbi:hypothetical protein F5I97DRAFT_1803764 [Phlebopus sp. FC_14]|nr:hypothetical protein F5I97DRAFT_1803764 [Phlebopus sp. FC_14]